MFQMLIVSVHDYCHLRGLLEFKGICHFSLMLLDKPIKKRKKIMTMVIMILVLLVMMIYTKVE